MGARLEIDALKTLTAIAELGGVTRAAERLSLTQSAVSHKIRRLEESIDCQLLRREPKAPLLTDEGYKLLAYAERIVVLHDEALSLIGRTALDGKIRLGITEETTNAGLAKVLARFQRFYPKVSIRTHVSQSLLLARQVEAHEIDLAVMQVFSSERRPDDILLGPDKLVWAGNLEREIERDKPVPFISFDQDCFYRRWVFQQADETARPIETVLECSSLEGVCSAVMAGLGVTVLSHRHLRQGMRDLTGLLPEPPEISYVVRKSAGSISKAKQALITEICQELTISGFQ